jgi:uncharacterized membrane protein
MRPVMPIRSKILNPFRRKERLFTFAFILTVALFAVLYGLTSLVPHSLFKTHALDLGMFNHAVYSYAHLRPNNFTLDISGAAIPYLGDHFSPITMLYAPFYYLFGSYTLLIIQTFSILFGGIGVYQYARFKNYNNWISLLFMIHFLILWPIFSALSFDFHNNVVAAMLVPWLVLYFEKGNLKYTLIFFVLILISKENMSLWLAFIILALLLREKNYYTGLSRKTAIILALTSLIYFVVVVNIIMPAYSKGLGTNQLGRYDHLGGSFENIIIGFFKNPRYYFTLLFEDTFQLNATGVKSDFWFSFLIAGGFAVIYKPRYLIMIAPVIAQKMFSESHSFWGTGGQYSIEIVPIISLALISLLLTTKKNYMKAIILVALIIFGRPGFSAFRAEHYKSDLDIVQLKADLKVIPPKAVISVSSDLSPHLFRREKIYHYPIIKDAEFIVLLKNRNPYPLRSEDFVKNIDKLKKDPASTILVDSRDMIIFKVVPNNRTSSYDPDYLEKIAVFEKKIRESEKMMNVMKEKAIRHNQPLDTVIRHDAIWLYNNQKSK